MDFQSSFIVAAFFFFFLFFLPWLARNFIQETKAKHLEHKLPPGPWKLPLLGNLHQLAAAGSLPQHALRELAHKYGPLMHLQLGEISAVVVSSMNMAKEIMKTNDLAIAQRPQSLLAKILLYETADIVFAPYGDYWRQMRKICTLELLSSKRVQSFSFIREDEVDKFIGVTKFSVGSPINLTAQLFYLVSAMVCRAAFGETSTNQDEFISLLKKVLELFVGFDLADLFPSIKPIHLITGTKTKLEKIEKQKNKLFDDIIKENQEKLMGDRDGNGKEVEDNLVQILLRIQKSGSLDIPITNNNIKAVILDMFAAGTDTSVTTIEWAMSEMMKNVRVMKKVQAEIRETLSGKKTIHETDLHQLSYLKSTVKETLRLHPPVPLLLRECRVPCTIDVYEIPVKTEVIVNAWALGRDPEHWHEAESFIPERFHGSSVDFKGNNFEYIPFGAGRRICPGSSMGIANIELPLARLLYHFDWELPNGMKSEDLDMTEAPGLAAGRKNNLYLVPTCYYPPLDDNAN